MNLSILEMATQGFWLCQDCERVTELKPGRLNACARCGGARVEWREAVLRVWLPPPAPAAAPRNPAAGEGKGTP